MNISAILHPGFDSSNKFILFHFFAQSVFIKFALPQAALPQAALPKHIFFIRKSLRLHLCEGPELRPHYL